MASAIPQARPFVDPAVGATTQDDTDSQHVLSGNDARRAKPPALLRKRRAAANGDERKRRSGHSSSSSSDTDYHSFGRTRARVQWVLVMWCPFFLLAYTRADAIAAETNGVVVPAVIVGVGALLALLVVVNEFLFHRRLVYYVVSFLVGFAWGSVFKAFEELTAARLGCVCVFGIAAGQLRYHWLKLRRPARSTRVQAHAATTGSSGSQGAAIANPLALDVAQLRPRGPAAVPPAAALPARSNDTSPSPAPSPPAGGGDAGASSSSAVPGGSDADASPDSRATTPFPFPKPQPSSLSQPQVTLTDSFGSLPDSLSFGDRSHAADPTSFDYYAGAHPSFFVRLTEVVKAHIGIAVWFGFGELMGAALLVPGGLLTVIPTSWWGYTLMIALPTLTYRLSSGVSHIMVMLFGTRTNIADASGLLVAYWVSTTVLSLTTICGVLWWFFISIVPYVWSLQLLVAPYGMVTEFFSFESRKFQQPNPYRHVALSYSAHIEAVRSANRGKH